MCISHATFTLARVLTLRVLTLAAQAWQLFVMAMDLLLICKVLSVQGTRFSGVRREEMRPLFAYLGACLEQIVKDNELGALKQALVGGYVEPGPGGDPIRCAAVASIDASLRLWISGAALWLIGLGLTVSVWRLREARPRRGAHQVGDSGMQL